MFLNNLLSILIFFGSFSVRSPKIEPNPLDYELAGGFEATIDSTYLHLENQFERELGSYYREELYSIQKDFNYFFVRDKYLYKRSKNLRYNQFDLRYKYSYFSVGYALKHTGEKLYPTHNIGVGINVPNININKWKIDAQLNASGNFNGITGISLHSSIQYQKFYFRAYYERQYNIEDISFKIGIEIDLFKKNEKSS